MAHDGSAATAAARSSRWTLPGAVLGAVAVLATACGSSSTGAAPTTVPATTAPPSATASATTGVPATVTTAAKQTATTAATQADGADVKAITAEIVADSATCAATTDHFCDKQNGRPFPSGDLEAKWTSFCAALAGRSHPSVGPFANVGPQNKLPSARCAYHGADPELPGTGEDESTSAEYYIEVSVGYAVFALRDQVAADAPKCDSDSACRTGDGSLIAVRRDHDAADVNVRDILVVSGGLSVWVSLQSQGFATDPTVQARLDRILTGLGIGLPAGFATIANLDR